MPFKSNSRPVLVALLLMTVLTSSCVSHYTNVSDDVAVPYAAKSPVGFKVYDRVKMSGAGPRAVVTTLRQHEFFRDAVQSYDIGIAEKGIFVEVTPKYQEPSFMALVFGYFSLSTLTILPAISDEDGFDLRFEVYRDGKQVMSREYPARRFMVMWIATLPFYWLNGLAASEEEAFAAITQQFLIDAQPVLSQP